MGDDVSGLSGSGLVPRAIVERLRKQFEGLIANLHGQGLAEAAYRIADVAVAEGLFPERMHRPITQHPTSGRAAFFDSSRFWFTAYLEERWELLRAELDAVVEPAAAGFSSAGMVDASVRGGRWHQLMLWDRGRRFDRACELLPVTAEVLAAIPEVTEYGNGFAMVSWLQPGAWITPHCGPTNSKARTHLCLRSDPKAWIRVGEERRSWQEGRCLVFDDSFEHEVRHEGSAARVVLILDTPNPCLLDREQVLRRDQESWAGEIESFMREMRLHRIERDGDVVRMAFDEPMVEFVRAYLDTRALAAVELQRDGLTVTPSRHATPPGYGA
ncbi:aspartyl/asparaginyl beta-hydroxylase domain-containing protein [Micromonospora okii]|uniref:aspartyl/asparaginyl beta-hydroxylase domain-containing protein n=1 Tax=Micromonospora okii TaxID=1182970 RepID=UPI001E516A6D|nr:aspartyl/asparaginyl beta-hydroxylase domain-containing protein [Micromonospora okii]